MIQPQLAHGARYAVAAGHTAATEAAARVLEGGGNAIDAALAGAGVLSVVLPYACGLGGDLFALVHDAKSRATLVLNASGRAPGRFAFSGDIPRTGAQSATVPGMPKGWMALAERFGTRPLAELLQPAVVLARDGFPAHRCQLENTTGRAKSLSRDAEASRLFLPGGKPHAGAKPFASRSLPRHRPTLNRSTKRLKAPSRATISRRRTCFGRRRSA